MKISWGTGIVIAFVAFIGFILYFVVIASTDEKANHDLVTDHYYEQELDFQKQIDAAENAGSLDGKIGLKQTAAGLFLIFPKNWDHNSIKGNIELYRPSNKNLDFELPIELMDSAMLVPSWRLPEGRWNLTVKWGAGGMEYLQKEHITLMSREQLSGSEKSLKR